jgi:hypothetical protein
MTVRKKSLSPAASRLKPANRCAIYTRKSCEEGLELEFNSLHAQRESAEAFIASKFRRRGHDPRSFPSSDRISPTSDSQTTPIFSLILPRSIARS